MVNATHRSAAALILAAMWQVPGSGYPSSFMVMRPGQHPGFGGGIGQTVYFSRREMMRACLFIRKSGPSFLAYVSISDIWSMITRFVTSSYWTISNETFLARYTGSYAEHLSDEGRARFTSALSTSPIFAPTNELTLFPLMPVRIETGFTSPTFFLRAPSELGEEIDPAMRRHLMPEQFPPFSDMQLTQHSTPAWLGIRAPNRQVARKMRAVILGALSLTPSYGERHMFSGRKMFGGTCTVTDSVSVSFGREHTPAMMHDIVVSDLDRPWLTRVSDLLTASDRALRRQRHALEYFFRAWPLKDPERFPVLCMALDALFGDASQATQAVIDGVRRTISPQVDDDRLRLLMKLRASVIHGGAPDVYDSSKYAQYYDRYAADPIRDLELVVASCLRTLVFDGELREHDDPHAALKAEMIAKKRLPEDDGDRDILSPSSCNVADPPPAT